MPAVEQSKVQVHLDADAIGVGRGLGDVLQQRVKTGNLEELDGERLDAESHADLRVFSDVAVWIKEPVRDLYVQTRYGEEVTLEIRRKLLEFGAGVG